MPDSTYICPGCKQPLAITGVRQRRTLAAGGAIYHSRDCQILASQETRPCSAPGCPNQVTRRKSGFTGDTVACSPKCRGALKRTKQTYECALPGCKVTVERTPASVLGAVYCSREHNAIGQRSTSVMVPCAFDGVRFLASARRAAPGKPIYCSHEHQKAASRIELPCTTTGCAATVVRYKSQLPKLAPGSQHRVFCDTCCANGAGFKPRKGTYKPCGWTECGQPVYRSAGEPDGRQRYCSMGHKAMAMRGEERVPRVERSCIIDGTLMLLTPQQVRQDVQTCKPECTAAARRRKPGERYVDKRTGYAVITTSDGRAMSEHRHVMEQMIGRPMLPSETAHHLTGGFAGRSDNAPGNLELWTGRHPSGHRIVDVVAYCREMLAVYGTAAEQGRYAKHRDAVLSDTAVADEAW